MSASGIDNILQQLQAASALVSGTSKPASNGYDHVQVDFAAKLKEAVDQVNHSMQSADKLSSGFVSDDPSVDLHEVMVSLQKANVSFQSMIQVRNKLVTAYQEIMNMQV